MRRKDEVWRRQEKHTHSEVADGTMEGRNEPLSDWKAIVWVNGVAVLSPYLSSSAGVALPGLAALRRALLLLVGIWIAYPNPDPDLGFDTFVAKIS